MHAQGESEGCEDLVRGNAISAIVNGIFGGNLLAGAGCNADTEDDTVLDHTRIHDDEIDVEFSGPQFGVQDRTQVVASKAGIWALQFRIERAEGED